MTTIDGVITNDMDFKHLDTTKNIVITPKDEFGNSVQLNASHTWTAKVSDGTNYVGDYQVTLESNSIVVNSADFTSLPAGSYHLEVWEEWIDSNSKKQRSIYPSPQRTIDFTIYQNITDLVEKEIKTIGFQDVVDQAVMNIGMNYVFKVNTIEPDQTATVVQAAADGKNYVTFNIPRGDKGNKGDVGPAPTLKIGTVTKLNSDQTPTANISGDNGAYTLDLGIPQGPNGDTQDLSNYTTFADLNNGLSTKVTDNKNGTISVNGTSILPANEDVLDRIDWAYKDMNDIPMGWLYLNGWADTSGLSNWGLPQDFYYIHCYKTDYGTPTTIQIAYGTQLNSTYVRTKSVDGWTTWKLLADDSKVVHNTGNETLAGDKVFAGNTTLATTTILAGNYGLKVTTSGIQKTTDGKTWVPANI